MLKCLLAGAMALALSTQLAVAQTAVQLRDSPDGNNPVGTSGNPLWVQGSFAASIGGFAPNGNYAPLAVSTGSARVALPAGATIVIYNTGSNDAFVALGDNTIAATTAKDVVRAGQAIALTPGANTYLAAITASSTTNLTLSGGAGLYTGVGAAGSGGGGGAVTAVLGAFVDGAIATIGAEADSAWSSGSGTLVAIMKAMAGSLSSIATNTTTTNTDLGPPGATACATDTGSCSLNAQMQRLAQRLSTLITAVNSPMQNSGGSVGISGTLPAFASTPAFSISGTLPAFASTPAFSISGTLPAFAATPTVNLGTLNGAATASNQTTGNSTLSSILSALNFPMQQTGGSVTPVLATAGGWTPKLLNGLSNTATAVKASGGQLGMLFCWNPNASVEYVQVFNIAAGSVTVGTSTPLASFPIPPTNSSGYTLSLAGLQFGTAISVAATTLPTGGTAPGTALDCNAGYN